MYKRQAGNISIPKVDDFPGAMSVELWARADTGDEPRPTLCLLYTSDAAAERSSVDLGGRLIIKKKKRTGLATSDLAAA